MIIDAVDQADIPVAKVLRAEIFRRHVNFRVSHVFIFNSRGELLIQRLALKRDRNPGAWGSSVAAYLFSDEHYEQAARRRVTQELGIADFGLAYVGKTEMFDDGCLKFISLFESLHEGPFKPDPSQIDQLEFVPIDGIVSMLKSASRTFTPTFVRVFEFYYPFWLARSK